MSKAAHFRFHGLGMDVELKCPDDESLKTCIDSATQLVQALSSSAARR
jgi:hypothetical protein